MTSEFELEHRKRAERERELCFDLLNSIETNPSRLHNINASITDEGDGFKYVTLNISGVVTDDMKKVARFHYVAEYGDD